MVAKTRKKNGEDSTIEAIFFFADVAESWGTLGVEHN
jgi:hypothetical protein